jgi:hypothetical protein
MIKDSVAQAVRDKAEQYISFIGDNRDYAGIEGTEDAWLQGDGFFMSARLRESYADGATMPEVKAGDLYSQTDLVGNMNLRNANQSLFYDSIFSFGQRYLGVLAELSRANNRLACLMEPTPSTDFVCSFVLTNKNVAGGEFNKKK